jgi:hypothetical protein
MGVKEIVAEIDRQITHLKEARALLAGQAPGAKKRGRPLGSTNAVRKHRKHRLSPEGRKRISEALKRRWALRRKAAGKAAK